MNIKTFKNYLCGLLNILFYRMVRVFMFLLLLNFYCAYDPSAGVKSTYYGHDFHRAKHLGIFHNYVVKVIVGKTIMGVGVHIKHDYVLTSRLYGKSAPDCKDIIIATWDSSKRHRRSLERPVGTTNKSLSVKSDASKRLIGDKQHRGDYRQVLKVYEHPNSDQPCNYDLLIMKTVAPFKKSLSIGTEPKISLKRPRPRDKCLIAAAFPDKLLAQRMTIQDKRVCNRHKRIENYEACQNPNDLICITMDVPVYGAPLICRDKVMGLVPRDIDFDKELAVVQYIGSYLDWIEDVTKAKLKLRTSLGHVEQISKNILIYCCILICIYRDIIKLS